MLSRCSGEDMTFASEVKLSTPSGGHGRPSFLMEKLIFQRLTIS